MYTDVDLNDLKIEATDFIMNNDRMMYKPFFETAEAFCAANGVLIGGRCGIDLIIGRPLSKDIFFWDLYCDDAFNIAKKFAVALFNTHSVHVPAETVELQTNIKNAEFSVFIHARPLFNIFALDKYRGIKLIDLMGPAIRTSYFTRQPIKCLSEEMYLLEIYRNLYTPNKCSTWIDDVANEQAIYELISGALKEKAVTKLGGKYKKEKNKESLRSVAYKLQPVILRKLTESTANILIGDHALGAMKIMNNPQRIQLITSEEINVIVKQIEYYVKPYRGMQIKYVKFHLNIPSDFQILKYSIYLTDGKEQSHLLDLFNSTAYEMIPYVISTANGTKNIANPWVILRFLFIDLWVLKLIMNLKDGNQITDKILINLEHADKVRSFIMQDIQSTFQLTNYHGVYLNEKIEKKKLIKEIGMRYPKYYPAKDPSVTRIEKIGSGTDDLPEVPDTELDILYDPITATPLAETKPLGFHASPIDLTIDVDTKKKIIMKITGKYANNLLRAVTDYARSQRQSFSKWGINKNIGSFYRRNKPFLRYIPSTIDTIVDFGCGDGLDIVAIKQQYQVQNAISADIEDTRDAKYAGDTNFLQIELNKPLDIPSESANLVLMFHVIHHITDDLKLRLQDICRILQPGGLLFIKDHDVRTAEHASNVDFEHLVYLSAESDIVLETQITDFPTILPMHYYSSDEMHGLLNQGGQFEQLWTGVISPLTYVYGAVYKKI